MLYQIKGNSFVQPWVYWWDLGALDDWVPVTPPSPHIPSYCKVTELRKEKVKRTTIIYVATSKSLIKHLSLSRGTIGHTRYPSQRLHQVYNTYLLTIISSPSPVAKHREPATLVAIFSRGRVTIGRPAQRTSVPVVCALHSGLQVRKNHTKIQVNEM